MRRLLLALLVVLPSCDSGGEPSVSADSTSSSSSSAPPASVPQSTTTSSAFVPTALPAEGQAPPTRGYLAAVRVAANDGYDRVVFEFQDALPGYRVATTRRPVTADGSGDTVEVKGEVLYEVRLENSSMVRFEGEQVVPVYRGDKRITIRGEVVEEAVNTGDFEGVVTWVIGARPAPDGVRVTTLMAPFRLVVDLGSPR